MPKTKAAPSERNAWIVYTAFLAVPVLFFFVFFVYPVLDTVILSFQRWNGFSPVRPFVGWRNYQALLGDDRFWRSLANNLRWLVFYLLAPTALGLVLALLINGMRRGQSALKAIYFLPYTIPPVAVAAMWRWLYEPSAGLVTRALEGVGLGGLAANWLGDPALATYSVMGAALWWSTGFAFIVYFAGLRNLPQECIEAARIDGGTEWQVFWKVTFPLLWPSTAVALGMSSVDAMRLFDIVWAMTRGGPSYATDVLATQMYDVAFGRLNMGQASAIAVCLLLVAAVVIMPFVVFMARRVDAVSA